MDETPQNEKDMSSEKVIGRRGYQTKQNQVRDAIHIPKRWTCFGSYLFGLDFSWLLLSYHSLYVQSSNYDHITTVECVSADGNHLPTMVIYTKNVPMMRSNISINKDWLLAYSERGNCGNIAQVVLWDRNYLMHEDYSFSQATLHPNCLNDGLKTYFSSTALKNGLSCCYWTTWKVTKRIACASWRQRMT